MLRIWVGCHGHGLAWPCPPKAVGMAPKSETPILTVDDALVSLMFLPAIFLLCSLIPVGYAYPQPRPLRHPQAVRLIVQWFLGKRFLVIDRPNQVAREALTLKVRGADGDMGHCRGGHFALQVTADGAG